MPTPPDSGASGAESSHAWNRADYVDERLKMAGAERGESRAQTLDRNVGELLQELRVAITGVQVFFGFLLSLAFTQKFDDLSRFELTVYVVTLVSCALATVLLIAPVPFHRILFRRGQKEILVVAADRLAMAGLALLAIALSSGVLLITHVVLVNWLAWTLTAMVLACCLVFWYSIPLMIRRRERNSRE